jgi:hypothetical protein
MLLQVSEKQLYEAEKTFKMYEAMIAAMDEEVWSGMRLGRQGLAQLILHNGLKVAGHQVRFN